MKGAQAKEGLKVKLLDLSKGGLKEALVSLGEPAYRVDQLWHWVYQRYSLSYEKMTNLPKKLRKDLAEAIPFELPECLSRQVSMDGSEKFAFRLSDGAIIEAVRMPKKDRVTLCLSSQAGCPLGCLFCRTGKIPGRNLKVAEIIGQFLLCAQGLAGERLNVVFMGMGEPLLNLSHVKEVLLRLYPSISPRRITVSTIGLLEYIPALGQLKPHPRLAVSLNSGTDELRHHLMPATQGYTLRELFHRLDVYPRRTGERVTLEYIMIKGITDKEKEKKGLINLLKTRKKGYKVNLIPFNPFPEVTWEPSSEESLNQWAEDLAKAGITVTIRRSRGRDILGACGQLSGKLFHYA